MDASNIEMPQVDVKLAQETRFQTPQELDVISDKAALVVTKSTTLATDALHAHLELPPTLGPTNVSLWLQPDQHAHAMRNIMNLAILVDNAQ